MSTATDHADELDRLGRKEFCFYPEHKTLEAIRAGADALRKTAVHINHVPLSTRVRPNVEAAPWVIEEIRKLEQRITELQAENERLRGIKPMLPPMPPLGDGLWRYGIRWNGPESPLAVPMDDGYWTPYHLAAEILTAARELTDKLPKGGDALRHYHATQELSALRELIKPVQPPNELNKCDECGCLHGCHKAGCSHAPSFSRRENQIIYLLKTGLTQAEIARELKIQKKTVFEYVRRARLKTGTFSVQALLEVTQEVEQ